MPHTRVWSVMILACLVVRSASAQIPRLPTGFENVPVAGGLSLPTSLAFLPDGRLLVAELQTGRIVIVANGSTSTVGYVANVNANGPERGVLALAVDPGWPARPYVFVAFCHANPDDVRIEMITVTGDLGDPTSTNVSLGAGTTVLAGIPDLDPLHNACALRFGPDGMLYAGVGDDADPCRAQDLASPLGKILRLDVSGLAPPPAPPPPPGAIAAPGHPFNGPSPWTPLIWSIGLRNPFRFDFDPATQQMIVADVGASAWEEVNVALAGGANFGWPAFEGPDPSNACATRVAPTAPAFVMSHAEPASAIIGLGVSRGSPLGQSRFGPEFEGDVFVADFGFGIIRRLRPDSTGGLVDAPAAFGQPDPVHFATGLPTIVDAAFGPDGSLYYARLIPGSIWRIAPIDVETTATPTIGSVVGLTFEHPSDAGHVYACALSYANPTGVALADGRIIPLDPDPLFIHSLTPMNGNIFGNVGVLDANGAATSWLVLPSTPAVAGFEFVAAYLVVEGAVVRTISRALELVVQ